MKKIIFALLTIISMGSSAQTTYPAPDPGPCPQGFCPRAYWYNIDELNFHKPRTNCQSGFGFCFKGHWLIECVYCGVFTPVVKDGKVNVYLELEGSKAVIHLPIGLKALAGFSKEDFSSFVLDDDMLDLFKGKTYLGKLKGGIYQTTQTETEIIVKVDIVQ